MQKAWLSWSCLSTRGAIALGALSAIAFCPASTLAQLIPDNTLGAESSVINKLNELNERIDGGATRGANLFHSFLEFNVGEGRGVYFANPAGIENILSRVTGGNPSQILGRLGVLGGANLFLLNPNGIIFGPNASLDIKGSFVGSTADGIKLGEEGFFSATNPQESRLLSVNPGALFFNQAANQAGNIINQGNLAVGKDLTLSAGNLDLQGQLFAGGNLTLQGLDGVQIRDSEASPFIAAARGNLLIQGNQSVDIFALNHPESGLFSGGDMVLRSANTVGGDAHFWSGGSFRIEQLDGSLGDLYSPHDPVIRTYGDVFINSYQGASLHILAGGSVQIGSIGIIGADPFFGLVGTVTLSNGQPISINGKTEATVDIRAGVKPDAIGSPFFSGTGADLLFPPRNFTSTPSSANINIGTIFFRDNSFNPIPGKVLLTNQYQPNPLLQGDIQVYPSLNNFPNLGLFGVAIDTSAVTRGGTVAIDSKGGIIANGTIETSALSISSNPNAPVYQGNGGNVTILANNNIIFTSDSSIYSNGFSGGNINLKSRGGIFFNTGGISTNNYSVIQASGDVTFSSYEGASLHILAGGLVFIPDTIRITGVGNTVGSLAEMITLSDGTTISIDGSAEPTVDIRAGTMASGNPFFNTGTPTSADIGIGNITFEQIGGNGGRVFITNQYQPNTSLETLRRGISVVSISTGDVFGGGSVTIDARSQINLTGVIASAFDLSKSPNFPPNTFPPNTYFGNGGNVNLLAKNDIAFTSGIFSVGLLGGNITIKSDKNIFLNGTNIGITNWTALPEVKGGNINISANLLSLTNSSIIGTSTVGRSNAGDVSVKTGQLRVQQGSLIDSTTVGEGQGGMVFIDAQESVQLVGFLSRLRTLSQGQGKAGDIIVNTKNLLIENGATIEAITNNRGFGGNLTINASESVQLIGTAPNDSNISGLFAQTKGQGNAGTLTVNTRQLLVKDGAQIVANTLSEGAGGNLVVNASESVQVSGISAMGKFASGLLTSTLGKGEAGDLTINTPQLQIFGDASVSSDTVGDGFAGDLTINTGKLLVRDGSQISNGTFAQGNAGILTINATDSIELIGTSSISSSPSGFFASAGEGSTGNAGKIRINTRDLLIRDGAEVFAGSASLGTGGQIEVNASESVQIIGRSANGLLPSGISNQTVSKKGTGNLEIKTRELLIRDGALVDTQTAGEGKGGNLTINAFESVQISGFPSGISTRTQGKGDAGNLSIITGKLILQDRARVGSDSVLSTGLAGDAGQLNIDTKQLIVEGISQISSGTFGQGQGGTLTINATDFLEISGTSEDGRTSSGLFTQTDGKGNAGNLNIRTDRLTIRDQATISSNSFLRVGDAGNAGDININTRKLILQNGSKIDAGTVGHGNGGTLTVNAADSVEMSGIAADGTVNFLVSATQGSGTAGNLNITTGQLRVLDGSQISSGTSGEGQGGTITINAAELVEVAGSSNKSLLPSSLITASQGSGNAGNLTVTTRQLMIRDRAGLVAATNGTGKGGKIEIQANDISLTNGARVTASTFGNGDAGSVSIRDAETVSLNNSAISTLVNTDAVGQGGNIDIQARSLSLNNNAQINASTFGQGQGGKITIQTSGNSLTLTDGSQISSRSQGQGNAGNILIHSQGNVSLTNSDITTSSEQTAGGAITITAKNIRLYGDSDIRTNVASGAGGGGDITLKANNSILAYGDSDILAFARDGRGGNITLDTPIFFGEGFQPAPKGTDPNTLDGNNRVDINASGAVSGVITIPDLSFIRNSLTELPENLVNTDQLIANSCVAPNRKQAGTFIITGSGGLPVRPNDPSISSYSLETIQTVPAAGESNPRPWQIGDPIIEPQGVYRLSDGQLVLSRECQ